MPLADIHPGDDLAVTLTNIIKEYKPKTILEIGSSDGSGSSTIIAEAIKNSSAQLYCMELMPDRFSELKKRMLKYPNVVCFKVSSVDLSGVVSQEYVYKFREDHRNLNIWKLYKMPLVMQWYEETVTSIPTAQITDGIEYIKKAADVSVFDMAFIDGSPFTAMAELDKIYGSSIIVMDDTMDIKCYDPMMRLLNDSSYELIKRNDTYRNGFAVFKKVN